MRDELPPIASNVLADRCLSSPSQPDFVARARRNGPVTILQPHAFSWWRTLRAEQFKRVHVQIARHRLTKFAIIGEPHWGLGAAGDAAVAIGVALRIRKRAGNPAPQLDLAMTAVACAAIEGNLAATFLMSSILEHRRDIDERCGPLADSWLVHQLRKRPRRSLLLRASDWKPDREKFGRGFSNSRRG
jgi:hypothetical protein